MKIYFAATQTNDEKLKEIYSRIIDCLAGLGVTVLSNQSEKNLSGFSASDLEKIEAAGEGLLEKMEALIIEGSDFLPEAGYLIALALTHKKPILYLYPKTQVPDQNLQRLQQDKATRSLLTLQPYYSGNLPAVLQDFLRVSERGRGRELPTIKFTLRLTPRIDRYLAWKTNNTKLTKADFLREMIEGLIDKDQDYNRFIK